MKKYKTYEETHKTIEGILYKQCTDCEEWFIANRDNFNTIKTNKDGLNERCKVCQKLFNQKIYKKNKEERKKKQKEYYWNNKEADNERGKQRYKNNIEYYRAKSRRLRSSPDCKYQEKEAEWRKNNPNKIKEYGIRYSNKAHNITQKEWISCKEYFDFTCAYCGMTETEHKEIYNQQLHKEHVDCNGEGNLQNCVPSCKRCNSEKHIYKLEDWYKGDNPKFNQDRLDKIYKWINEDYLQYIVEHKPKKKYTYKNKLKNQ